MTKSVDQIFEKMGGEGGFLGSFAAGGSVFWDRDLQFKVEVGTTIADLYKKLDQNCLSNFPQNEGRGGF